MKRNRPPKSSACKSECSKDQNIRNHQTHWSPTSAPAIKALRRAPVFASGRFPAEKRLLRHFSEIIIITERAAHTGRASSLSFWSHPSSCSQMVITSSWRVICIRSMSIGDRSRRIMNSGLPRRYIRHCCLTVRSYLENGRYYAL